MTARVKTIAKEEPTIRELLEELEAGLLIDKNDLDEELIRHPDLFYRVSKELTMLTSRRDAAKQEIAAVEAEADARARRAMRKGDEKVTEPEVKARIRLDKDVEDAYRVHQDLARDVGLFSALKEAYQSRSYVIKDLVQLWIANYYGDKAERHTRNAVREHTADDARRVVVESRRQRRE